jgi:hypothetical protein
VGNGPDARTWPTERSAQLSVRPNVADTTTIPALAFASKVEDVEIETYPRPRFSGAAGSARNSGRRAAGLSGGCRALSGSDSDRASGSG